MFQVDLPKIDRDIAYVAMVVHVGRKLLFPMFLLFFLDICCKCVYLSHICCMCVYLDVAYILQWLFQAFPGVFTSVSDIRCKCFNCFRAFVVKVLFGRFKSRLGVASPFSPSATFASVSSCQCW
jgi:hypothetical protein